MMNAGIDIASALLIASLLILASTHQHTTTHVHPLNIVQPQLAGMIIHCSYQLYSGLPRTYKTLGTALYLAHLSPPQPTLVLSDLPAVIHSANHSAPNAHQPTTMSSFSYHDINHADLALP